MIQKHTTSYDPFNTTKTNYNPHGIKKITKSVFFNHVINTPFECGTCLVNFENPLKPCYQYCKFRARFQYNLKQPIDTNTRLIDRKYLQKYICVETRYNKKDPNSIYIRRNQLFLNYYMDLDFIFRTANSNGLHGHHINRISYNDLLENIVILHYKKHNFKSFEIDHCDLFYEILEEVPKYIKKGKIYIVNEKLTRKYTPPVTYIRQSNRLHPTSLI